MCEWWESYAYLGDGQAVLEVDIFTLDITDNLGVLRSLTSDLESDVGRGEGLDLERGTLDGVVLLEEVSGRLAEILYNVSTSLADWTMRFVYTMLTAEYVV